VLYASAIGFGIDKIADWVSDPAPLSTLGTKFVGGWIAPWIDIALIIDMMAVASAFMATTARGWFALGRHGLLPRSLASTSQFDTPLGGNILVAILAVVLIVLTLLFRMEPMSMFTANALTGTLMISLIYILLALLAFRLVPSNAPWQYVVVLLAIITPILAVYGSIVPFPPYPANVGVWCSIMGVVIAAVWTLAASSRVPQSEGLEAGD
jgi:amino acid transporter